jgi:hypothetical protein
MASRSPNLFSSKLYLLEAELAAFVGNRRDALAKYEESYRLAVKEELWSEAGFSCELAAVFLGKVGQSSLAQNYVDKAIAAYEKWGAFAKVEHVMKCLSLPH